MVKTGCQWRFLPNDFPPWTAVYQQARRWMQAGGFKTLTHDLRIIMRVLADRDESPSAVTIDARTLQSTPESGGRAGDDGAQKRTAAKFTQRLIRWEICSPSRSQLGANKSDHKSVNWLLRRLCTDLGGINDIGGACATRPSSPVRASVVHPDR